MINLLEELHRDDADYLFNVVGIDNHNRASSSRLRYLYDHIRDHDTMISGDVFEFGVFRGASLLSIALLLKRIGSTKKVYGFDSFSGFPSYAPQDDLRNFEKYGGSYFGEKTIRRANTLKKLKQLQYSTEVDGSTISASGDFSAASEADLRAKIEDFKLDNIELVVGNFAESVPNFFSNFTGSIFGANIDCDLYEGYKVCLPYVWEFLNPKGYVHLDEYYSLKFPGAKIACDEFSAFAGVEAKMQPSNGFEFERWYLTK